MSQLPQNIIKRDGSAKPFDQNKIVKAIAKAGLATGEFGPARAREITDNSVTIRDRDTMQQERIPIENLSAFLHEHIQPIKVD